MSYRERVVIKKVQLNASQIVTQLTYLLLLSYKTSCDTTKKITYIMLVCVLILLIVHCYCTQRNKKLCHQISRRIEECVCRC